LQPRLYRSRNNRVILGVCGGLGEYFRIDPVLIRVIAVLLLIPGVFPVIIAYLVMAIIVPVEGSTSSNSEDTFRENISDMQNTTANLGKEIRTTFESHEAQPGTPDKSRPASSNILYILAIILIAIGAFFLLVNVFSWFSRFVWPSLLIIAGIIIVVLVARRRK
jgi:phage shock protein C